jgi:UPF0176 protein
MQSFSIVTSYKFVKISNVCEIRDLLKELCSKHNIKGTILVASEGINFTIAGVLSDLEDFLRAINEISYFADLKYNNYTQASFVPFKKMKVRLKNEIVALKDTELDMHSSAVGHYLDAPEWNKLISEEGVLVIDTRNSYEVAYGTFKSAVNPDTQSFSEFPEWFEKHCDDKNKKVAMFCTGGIRCEKSTAYVRSLGFENVYHLKGGVLKYFEDTKGGDNMWDGSLFIFDDRIALDKDLNSINQNQTR